MTPPRSVAVVYDPADRHTGRQRRQPADVVAVEVRRDEEIEAIDPGVPQRGLDPFGVTCVLAVPTGIHEDRLVRRGDDEGGGTPLAPVISDITRSGSSAPVPWREARSRSWTRGWPWTAVEDNSTANRGHTSKVSEKSLPQVLPADLRDSSRG